MIFCPKSSEGVPPELRRSSAGVPPEFRGNSGNCREGRRRARKNENVQIESIHVRGAVHRGEMTARRRNRTARSPIAPDDGSNANRWHYFAFGAILTTLRQKSVKKIVRQKTLVFFAVSVTVLCVGACWWPLATLLKEWRGFGWQAGLV